MRLDSHGKELVRYVAELEPGMAYGPTQSARLIAATLDPVKLDPESAWFLATTLSLAEASPEQVYEFYHLRDWIEHFYKPAKLELGWADYQMRSAQAIVRHWQMVMLAYIFSLLVGVPHAPRTWPLRRLGLGEKSAPAAARVVWNATFRRVRAWLCPWARLQLYWQHWSTLPRPANWPGSSTTSLAPYPSTPQLDQPALVTSTGYRGTY